MSRSYLPYLLIVVAVLGLFGPVLFLDRSFAMRDAAHFYHPLFEWTTSQWRSGRFPLWNPYENCGIPLLADASSSLLYPPKLLFLLPVDFNLLYKVYVVGHVFWAAWGMFRLGKAWDRSDPASTLAAIAYACGGNVAFQHCNVVFLIGAAWLPWALCELTHLLEGSGLNWPALRRLGIILALMVLGGDPQMAYHVLWIQVLGVCTAILWRKITSSNNTESATKASDQSWPVSTSLTVLVTSAILMLGLAAVQFLPSADAAKRSERTCYRDPRTIGEAVTTLASTRSAATEASEPTSTPSIYRGILGTPEEGMHHERLYDFSIGPWRWAEFIWPNIGGRMFPTQRRWLSYLPAEQRIWTPALYLGLLPALLGVLGLIQAGKNARQSWLRLVLIWFLLGSIGWYGIGWCVREVCATLLRQDSSQIPIGSPVGGVYWFMVTFLPGYVGFRYPAKLMVVAVAPLCLFAALQFDSLHSDISLRIRLRRVTKGLLWVSIGLAIIVAVFWRNMLPAKLPADLSHGPFDAFGAWRDIFFALSQTAIVLLFIRQLVAIEFPKDRLFPDWKLVALTAAELFVANSWIVPSAPANIWRKESAVVHAMHDDQKSSSPSNVAETVPRFYRGNLQGWRPVPFRQRASSARMQELTQWDHDSLFPKFGLPQQTSAVFSYGSIKPVDFESFFAIADRYGPAQEAEESGRNWIRMPHPAPLRLLATEYLVAPSAMKPQYGEQKPFATPLASEQEFGWGGEIGVWRLDNAQPRVWVVRNVEVMDSIEGSHDITQIDTRTEAILFPPTKEASKRRTRSFSKEAVVETTSAEVRDLVEKLKGDSSENSPSDKCEIVDYQTDKLQITAELDSPGLLILSEAYDPNWVATLVTEGASSAPVSVPVLRTNRVVRGLLLPAGKHTIQMQYAPSSFIRGAVISLFFWLAVVIWHAANRQQKKGALI